MIALIAARSLNNVIGKSGSIPWNIPGEQSQFRELTTGHTVIMGRKTYEDIGRPLPGRRTIVVSKSRTFEGKDLATARSLEEAIHIAGNDDIYIAGGYEIYREAIPYVDVMYLTEVDMTVEDGDVFFPEFDPDDFNMTIEETVHGMIDYTRKVYKRKLVYVINEI